MPSLFIIFLSCLIISTNSVSDDEIVERIKCVEYCHQASNRKCFTPPLSCGACVTSFVEEDGKCVPASSGILFEEKQVNTENQVIVSSVDGLNLAWIIVIAVLSGIVAFLLVALIVITVYCCIKSRNSEKESLHRFFNSDPPSYNGGPIPMAEDRKLAYSAQMYHFQHQKQQMIASEMANEKNSHEGSGENSDDEDHPDTIVYECQGLADNSVEMVVNNPYFQDTPHPPITNGPLAP